VDVMQRMRMKEMDRSMIQRSATDTRQTPGERELENSWLSVSWN
jgi:hypothetical protein